MFTDMDVEDVQHFEVCKPALNCKAYPSINPFVEANKGIIKDYDGQQLYLEEFYESQISLQVIEKLVQGKKYTILFFDTNLDPIYIHVKFISVFRNDGHFVLTYRQKWKRRDNVKIINSSTPFIVWESYLAVAETMDKIPLLNHLAAERDLEEVKVKSQLTATA